MQLYVQKTSNARPPFLSIFGLTRGKNKKVIEVSEKHFKTKKNIMVFFHMLGEGGQPTYGKFHMFNVFYF